MAIGITNAAILRRRRRGISTVITDVVAAELVWIDGPPTLNAIGATANSRAVVRNAEHQVLSALTPTYVSGTPSNVTIDANGLCTAVANGTSVITASYAGVTSITQTATVSQMVASISGVSSTLSTDDSSSGTFSPSGLDATAHAVSGATFAYSSDQPSVLSVNASTGAWAGQSAGTAHVTITASPGGATFLVTATVTHTGVGGTPTTVTVSPSSFTAATGSAQQLTAATLDNVGTTMTGRTYQWSTSDPTVATVSGTGLVTPVGSGTCTITAKDVGANITGTSAATVTGAPTIGPDDTVLLNSDPYFAAATQKSDLIQELGDPNGNVFWPYGQHSDNAWGFEPNLDGNGKKAIRVDWAQWHATTLTQNVVGSASPQTVTVADTTGMTTGGNILNVNPRGTGSEVLAQGAFTIVDGTHITGTFLNNHNSGELIGQSWEAGTEATKAIAAPTSQGAYYRLRYHVGKTASATTGIGTVPAFPGDTSAATYYNPGDLQYSGAKRFLLERTGRVYIIFTSSGGVDAGVHLSSDGINLSRGVNTGATFHGDDYIGQYVEIVIYFKPGSSGDGSTGTGQSLDGVFKLWINGVKFMDYNNLPFGTGQVNALQFPATFRSALHSFSEYFTGLHAWIPVPASSAPPLAPTVATSPTATQNSLTYNITAGASGDTPYTVIASVDENGTGPWVDQSAQLWTAGLGGTQSVQVSSLTAGKNYTGKIRFRLHDSAGDSTTVAVTDGTTASPPNNGSPTMSNASSAKPNSLTFAGTYNGTGNPATILRYQYSTAADMSGAVQGPDIPVSGATLNGAFSALAAVPSPGTLYYVQFAQYDGTTQSGWSTTVTGTTSASAHTSRSSIYCRDGTSTTLAPYTSLSAAGLPTTHDYQRSPLLRADLRAASGSSGGSTFVVLSGATPEDGRFGWFASPGVDAMTIPAGTSITFMHAPYTDGGTNAWKLAGVLTVWRPSTGAIVGRLYDSAAGIDASNVVSGFTGAGRLTTVTTAADVVMQDGDEIVWEPYYVGTGSGTLHFTYGGTDTITNGYTVTGSFPKTGITFSVPISFQS